MVFIRKKTRVDRGSVAKTCTSDKYVRAGRRFLADVETIRSKTTIFSKLFNLFSSVTPSR
jgi:hypothetical protein